VKRLIFLKVEYLDLEGKKVSKTKEQEMRTELCQKSIKQFKKDMKEWLDNKSIKIIKEYDIDEPSVIIQFEDEKLDELYKKLISVDIVDIIDSIIPKET
jgi:hypothetical protein